nr:hemerythrin domain-containing protein [uncultured Niameybacter sp.]
MSWRDYLNIGINIIDEQHVELLKIEHKIEQCLKRRCRMVDSIYLMNLIVELRNYVTYHFYEEEKLIAQINPSELKRHREKHEEFVEVITAIDCSELLNYPESVLRELQIVIREWFFNHIIKEDYEVLNGNAIPYSVHWIQNNRRYVDQYV